MAVAPFVDENYLNIDLFVWLNMLYFPCKASAFRD